MQYAGHKVRMNDERLPKISETKKQGGCRKWERPHLRWDECVMGYLRNAEEKEKWRENANWEQWKQ